MTSLTVLNLIRDPSQLVWLVKKFGKLLIGVAGLTYPLPPHRSRRLNLRVVDEGYESLRCIDRGTRSLVHYHQPLFLAVTDH